jgi:hypothetical protein
MAFLKKLGRLTGIYAAMHVAGLAYDLTWGRVIENREHGRELAKKIRKAQNQYIRDGNLTVDQLNAHRKWKAGSKLEEASQDEQDELQRKLQTVIYESDNRAKIKKYADARMAKHLLDHTQVRAVFQQMGGKAMPQHVGSDVAHNAGATDAPLDPLPHC